MIPVVVKLEHSAPTRTLKRDVREAQRVGFAAAAERWHSNTLPRHFDSGASMRYGYAPRTPRYDRRKMRVKGHRQPLVWSGTLMRSALRSARISATPTGAVVRFGAGTQAINFAGREAWLSTAKKVTQMRTVADYDMMTPGLTMRQRRRMVRKPVAYPNLPRELTAITEAETADFARFLEREVARTLRHKRRLAARS